ncbi:hypothetical protein [Limimonas halophila]|uniref:hypothetical protein n=1 Tax=Limimonas halophila TaxID=1082479 RepID=UPI001C409848|nr:hypothetical protein [Limimonas halophila]
MFLQIVMAPGNVRAILAGAKTQTRRLAWRPDGRPTRWRQLHDRVRAGEAVTLWVREAHAFDADGTPIYRATTARTDVRRWRSPIHMPWRACRLTLTLTDTRLAPVTAISEADARAEGAPPSADGTHRAGFREMWESLHGRGAWDADPEVVALSFTAHRWDEQNA